MRQKLRKFSTLNGCIHVTCLAQDDRSVAGARAGGLAAGGGGVEEEDLGVEHHDVIQALRTGSGGI